MFSLLRFAALMLCVQALEFPLKQAKRADVVAQQARRRSLHLLAPRASPVPCPDGHTRDTAGTCCPVYGESRTWSLLTFLILPLSAFSSATKLCCTNGASFSAVDAQGACCSPGCKLLKRQHSLKLTALSFEYGHKHLLCCGGALHQFNLHQFKSMLPGK